MQGKQTNLQNFPSQERKQKQKSLLTSIIRKQKKRFKNKRPGEGSGWEASSDRLEKATSRLVLDGWATDRPPPYLLYILTHHFWCKLNSLNNIIM